MVRLHPIPRRFMEEGQCLRGFQWIAAKTKKHERDPRPESLEVAPDSLRLEDRMPDTDAWRQVEMLRASPGYVASLEHLAELQRTEHRSLGIVEPKVITDAYLQPRTEEDRQAWLKTEARVLRQGFLFAPPKPLPFPDVEFVIKWACDDARCQGHRHSLKKWDLHERYQSLAGDSRRKQKLEGFLREQLDLRQRKVFFFMGSFRRRLFQFGLMDMFSTPRASQLPLFESD
ncbi:hypothetical protein LXT21_41070 [Myxococcus sp. K38C18041901]|uniref:hypothetical protein n=1 Tax=Myxococcus guangdongensis TaxID=2906760 RepID=UPI0020A7133A|nr:hypothetical protein [Myxococcus guangdongensis]MCP3065185.1 hypothetical protein [Myxococcus guangdongensis]